MPVFTAEIRFRHPHAARLVQGVIIIEREVILLLLVDGDPELLGIARDGRVLVGKPKQYDLISLHSSLIQLNDIHPPSRRRKLVYRHTPFGSHLGEP